MSFKLSTKLSHCYCNFIPSYLKSSTETQLASLTENLLIFSLIWVIILNFLLSKTLFENPVL